MPEPIRVLYCVPIGSRGGVERFLQDVLVRHDPSRVRATVVAFADGPWLKELTAAQIDVRCLDHTRLRHPWRTFKELSVIMQRERIQIVHSAYPWCHALSAPAATWAGCKRIWFHHGPIQGNAWQGATPLLPADLVLVNSDFLREKLQHTFYIAKKTAVVHYGIDAERFWPDPEKRKRFREQWGLTERQVAVGLIGYIDTWKGQDVFLEAALKLRSASASLRMFVVGGPRDGLAADRCQQFHAQLLKFAAEHGLQDSVTFTGHLDLREGALDGLDIVVHASTEPEPFGMVLLEAMAKGKAIIASSEGGPTEIFTDGVDGLLVPPRRPELLADCIQTLASDAGRREVLSCNARKTVGERFSADFAAAQLERHYQDLVQ